MRLPVRPGRLLWLAIRGIVGVALLAYPCPQFSPRLSKAPAGTVEEDLVAWFRRRPAGTPSNRPTARDDFLHLEQFVSSRRGVEAFLEPKTTVTEVTVLLIAHDGEWTRRRVPSVESARSWGNKVGIPVYDVALVGYPKRMREFNERRKQAESSGS
jgi:hypothetical protein